VLWKLSFLDPEHFESSKFRLKIFLQVSQQGMFMAEILPSDRSSVEAFFEPSIQSSEDTDCRWSDALKNAIRSGAQLLEILGLSPEAASRSAEKDFPVLVPREYLRRMRTADPHDPLLKQVLAVRHEVSEETGLLDPVGDQAVQLIPGLLQKYRHRALLIVSGACAVHCRYCFRRHYPYQSAPKGLSGWQPAISRIAQDPSIDEVILSGGDPLSVRDEVLAQLIDSLNRIQHLSRIRIHTRFPVVIPSRICQPLIDWVSASRCAIYFVLHFNHAAEIDSTTAQAIGQLRRSGATLLNQSVLLQGVNDSLEAQRDLCKRLIDLQILPYYLHQLDPVQGAMHFEVSDASAKTIIEGLRRELPGYAIPQLVREIAGQPHKMPL
jgi:L-lysine 2,3-aminomutase